MFDSMTLTKIFGAFFGALLVFLLLNWVGNIIYYPGEGHGKEAESVYPAPAEAKATETAAASTESAGPTVAEILAGGDAAKGAKVFSKCKACHTTDPGVNKVGPSLHGVVGRAIASAEGFKYSNALKNLGGNWTEERLFEFLKKPGAYAKGTKMSFAGLKKDKDRANIIAFLKTQAN